jgi:Ser/Thr protein kinase RdoA (MazF antagonist)
VTPQEKNPVFPVISSILSPASIALFVRENYALPADSSCRLLKTGINHSYRIDSTKGSFVFRVYSYGWRTWEDIQEELKLLRYLNENGISVSYPIADSTNTFIQQIQAPEGNRFAVLFSYAKGKKILNYSTETHFEIGKMMAHMHRLTNNSVQSRITYTPEVLLDRSIERIGQFLPNDSSEWQFLTETRPLLKKILLDTDKSRLRTGIVHLDIWFDNLNISDDNEITLFDFDNGYRSIEAITADEMNIIPTLGVCLYYFYLGIQCERFDNWSNTFLNEVYLKRFITVLIQGYYEKSK